MKKYFPVRTNTIRPNDRAPFDIYIQLSHRFVHYCRKGDEVEEERLRNLKNHGVRQLFILPEHEQMYLSYLEEGLNDLKDEKIDITYRSAMAHDSLLTTAEHAVGNMDTEEKFKGQQRRFDKIAEFIATEKDAIKEMLKFSGIHKQLHEHLAVVSGLSVALARKKGIHDKIVVFELGMAGLLHDLGKTRLNFDYMKPESGMTEDEFRLYMNHPQYAVDLLVDKPFINPQILQLILHHEERGVGKGYPDKLDLFKQELSLQILSLVNCFDHFSRQNKISHRKSLDSFFEKFGKDYDLELFTALGSVLN